MGRVKEARLHPGQYQAFASDARFVAMVCGVGAGKTFSGAPWLYNEISKYPGEEWMVVAPSFKLLRDASMARIIDFFKDTDAEGTLNKNEKIYYLPDGGKIYLRSASNPDALEGVHVKGIWGDEAGQWKRWAWVVCQQRVSTKNGRILLTTTPYGLNWLKEEVYDPATVDILDEQGKLEHHEDGRDDMYVISFPSVLNPMYDKEEYERQRESLTEEEFERRNKGLFRRLEGLVYPKLQSVNSDPYTPSTEDRRVGAIDPGMSDPTAVISGVVGRDSKVHLFREVYESDLLTHELRERLDPDTTYFIDPTERRERMQLEQWGLDVRKAVNDINPGVQKVREFIQTDRLVIPEDQFPNLLSEASTYVFDEKKDKPDKSTPHHLMDCLRYLVMGIEDQEEAEVFLIDI